MGKEGRRDGGYAIFQLRHTAARYYTQKKKRKKRKKKKQRHEHREKDGHIRRQNRKETKGKIKKKKWHLVK